jgi:excisionase family DNA binding protein
VTAQELADYLGIHRETVYEYTQQGAIPGHKIGRLWRYDLAEVLAELEVQTMRAAVRETQGVTA